MRKHGEGEHRECGDTRDARGESVKAVDKVDDVGERHEVDDCDGPGDPTELNELTGDEGVEYGAEGEAPCSGDGCGEHLPGELCFGAQLVDIVDNAGGKDDRKCRGNHGIVYGQRRVGDERGRPVQIPGSENLRDAGGDKSAEDGDATQTRNGMLVDTALGRVVHGIGAYGDFLCDGNKDKRRDKRDEGNADIRNELLHYDDFRHVLVGIRIGASAQSY